MKLTRLLCIVFLFAGCAGAGALFGPAKLKSPPEFNQKIILHVDDQYHMHQAPKSGYDVGDLENFHIQHTLPVVVEEAFKEIFGQVEILHEGPQVEVNRPDVPAIFEVRLIDAANDTSSQAADEYRGEVTLAIAMKSPREHIFWQKTFLGKGYVRAHDQYSTGLGPQDALVDALRSAVDQMQDAILASPEVRHQMKYYRQSDEARKKQEIKV